MRLDFCNLCINLINKLIFLILSRFNLFKHSSRKVAFIVIYLSVSKQIDLAYILRSSLIILQNMDALTTSTQCLNTGLRDPI